MPQECGLNLNSTPATIVITISVRPRGMRQSATGLARSRQRLFCLFESQSVYQLGASRPPVSLGEIVLAIGSLIGCALHRPQVSLGQHTLNTSLYDVPTFENQAAAAGRPSA
jgi:hypothetical protein